MTEAQIQEDIKQTNISNIYNKRSTELKNLPMTAETIKTMESAIGRARRKSKPIVWIVQGKVVSLTVKEAQVLADDVAM